MMKLALSIIVATFLISGCATLPDGFTMYPKPLQIGERIPQNYAVILVGVSGTASVDYLQFVHSAMPAINVRFPAQSNTIVAISIPAGIKQLSLSSIAIGGRPGGYFSGGMSYGYIGVHTPKIDINRPGVYYIATLNTNNPGQFRSDPLPEQLKQFRTNFKGTAGALEPINFNWPSQ